MKKLISTFLVSSLLLTSLTACGSSTSETADTTNDLGTIESGKLYVATNPTYAPFEYMDGTEMAGFDIDLLNAVADMAGLEVEYTALDFDNIIPAVQSGQYDIGMSGITVTEERKGSVLFSDPYFASGEVAILPLDSTLTSNDELEGLRLGAGLGTTGEQVASSLSDDTTFVDTDVALPMLSTGQMDAYICDYGVATNAVATGNYKMIDDPIQTEEMAMIFNLDDQALCDEMNSCLEEYMASDDYQALIEKYGL